MVYMALTNEERSRLIGEAELSPELREIIYVSDRETLEQEISCMRVNIGDRQQEIDRRDKEIAKLKAELDEIKKNQRKYEIVVVQTNTFKFQVPAMSETEARKKAMSQLGKHKPEKFVDIKVSKMG